MTHKHLMQFEAEEWLETEPQCEADIVKAYDRWRIARTTYLQGHEHAGPLVAASWAENCELTRALERWHRDDETSCESASG